MPVERRDAPGSTGNQCQPEAFNNAEWSLTNSLTKGTGACVEGYTGAPLRVCQADGTWSTSVTNPCSRTSRWRRGHGEAGGRVWSEMRARAAQPTRRRARANARLWPHLSTELQCPVSTTTGASWPITAAGSAASGTCTTGYVADTAGTPTRNCLITGVWDSTVATPCLRTSPAAAADGAPPSRRGACGRLTHPFASPFAGRTRRARQASTAPRFRVTTTPTGH